MACKKKQQQQQQKKNKCLFALNVNQAEWAANLLYAASLRLLDTWQALMTFMMSQCRYAVMGLSVTSHTHSNMHFHSYTVVCVCGTSLWPANRTYCLSCHWSLLYLTTEVLFLWIGVRQVFYDPSEAEKTLVLLYHIYYITIICTIIICNCICLVSLATLGLKVKGH